jgi:hypothetical protein
MAGYFGLKMAGWQETVTGRQLPVTGDLKLPSGI